ncbi:MAG TPA: sigma-70 family RNA polymerase sigma factor [Chthoniobacteraceae bacterium]|jgi:RNA polymerase sigma-70 factor (ECF subfamily)|nr:sigma-70 family RNA polymerase sigma factor [Chthoniobacteraceae bacterium]
MPLEGEPDIAPPDAHGTEPPDPNDGELVSRCQRGDAAAFNELVTRYRGKVYAMIYNMVHNEQDAWDLAQDGFLKAWKSIARFRGQSSFYTWLYRIMMNVTIDSLRRKQVGGETEFDDSIGLRNIDPGSVTTPRAGAHPQDKIAGDEIRSRIDAAILRLSPEHRAVILMREIDGMEYQEIADALDCSIGTVMSRLFYARKKMQSMLRDVYENL